MASCPSCGATTNPGATFCAACGATLVPPPAPGPTMPAPASDTRPWPAPDTRAPRPAGVTIVGVVMLVFGGIAALGIVFALLAALVVGAALGAAFGDAPWFGWLALGGAIATVVILFFALFALAFAALAIATGIGSLRGRNWAWIATLVVMALVGLNSLGALAARDGGGILGLLAAGLVIWYYLRPEVKAWFGRA